VLLVLLLVVLAVLSAAVWLAEHLAVLAGAALLIWGAFHLGHLHERRRARPDQAQPPRGWAEEPAAAGAMPTAALPLPDYGQDEPARLQAGPDDGDKLLADPMSGARPLWRP